MPECLENMQGQGVVLQRKGDGLSVRSTFAVTDAQAQCLKAHKPLLLAVLPDGKAFPMGAVLDALEAYQERIAIMEESGEESATALGIAQEQARACCP